MLIASTNVFFLLLHNAIGESEKYRALLGLDHNSTGHKKQSLNAHHFFFGLCGNLYVIIELIVQIKLDAEDGFRWKCGVGEANLPVCRISRRVLMFVHRLCRGMMRWNSCNYFLYRYHMQASNSFHVFLHEHL